MGTPAWLRAARFGLGGPWAHCQTRPRRRWALPRSSPHASGFGRVVDWRWSAGTGAVVDTCAPVAAAAAADADVRATLHRRFDR